MKDSTRSRGFREWFGKLREHHKRVMERNNQAYEKTIENKDERPFAYGICFSKLFILFMIGSFFGTVLETFYALFAEGHFEVRTGMVIAPFIPVYGGGAVLITLCLYKLYKLNSFIVFLAAAFIGAAFEFICSYFQEMFLGTISWDYSDTPFNIDGRTNLAFALVWGALGLLWIRYIYPFISRMIEKLPKRPWQKLTVIIFIVMFIGGVLTCASIERKGKRAENIPPSTVLGQFCDAVFTDEYMDIVFPHLGTKETFEEERRQKEEALKKAP